MSNDKIELKLKKHWDLSWHNSLPKVDEKGSEFFPIFAGKELELSRLSGLIANGSGGVIFIGGKNGAGKTSFAYKAIYSAKEKNTKLVCVPINNLILNPKDSENNQLVYETLKQMIRSAVKSKELEGKNGYDKLRNLKSLISLTTFIRKLSKADSNELNKDISLGVDLSKFMKLSMAFVISITPLFSHQYVEIIDYLTKVANSTGIPYGSFITKLISTTTIFISSIKLINFTYSKIEKKLSKKEKTYEIQGISIHELEQKFNEILNDLEESDTEIVFLFEELDHFDWMEDFRDNRLLNIFKSLKSLFHNSRALFIFLVGETTFKSLSGDPFRTIPTETFLIPKATPTDLLNYLNECLDDKNGKQSLNQQFALLIYRSKGNFYNLKKIIRETRKFDCEGECLLLSKLTDDNAFKASILLASFAFIEPYEINERDLIFDALMLVVAHFEQSLSINPVKHINIPIEIKNNENATKVLIAFIQNLFSIGKTFKSNIVIPMPQDPQKPETIYDISWQNLRDSLPNGDYSYLYKNKKGPILPEEDDFLEKYEQLRKKIDQINRNTELNLEEAMKEIQTNVGFPSTTSVNELIGNTNTALKLINNKTLRDRGEGWFEKIIQQFLPQIQRLIETVDKHIKLNGKAVVVIGEAEALKFGKEIKIALSNRAHQAGSEYASLVKFNTSVPKVFYKKFSLKIEREGILNILLGMNEWTTNSLNQEYLMVRFDNRTRGRNGLYKKSKGLGSWTASDDLLDKHEKPFEKQYMTLRITRDRKLTVYYPNGKVTTSIDAIKWFAFANELNEVLVMYNDF